MFGVGCDYPVHRHRLLPGKPTRPGCLHTGCPRDTGARYSKCLLYPHSISKGTRKEPIVQASELSRWSRSLSLPIHVRSSVGKMQDVCSYICMFADCNHDINGINIRD